MCRDYSVHTASAKPLSGFETAMLDVASENFTSLVYIVVFVGIPLMIAPVVIAICYGLSSLKKKKRELERLQNELYQPTADNSQSADTEQHDA